MNEDSYKDFLQWLAKNKPGEEHRLSVPAGRICSAWIEGTPMTVPLSIVGDAMRDRIRGLTNEYLRRHKSR